MAKSLFRALVLAAGVVAVSLALDVLVALYYQAGAPQRWGRQFLVFRMALHGATFVFSLVGAWIGFAFVRAYAINYGRVAALGAALGGVTFAAAIAGIRLGVYWAILAWLIAGS